MNQPDHADQAHPIRSIDDDVAIYVDLSDRISELEDQRKAVVARLAERGPGKHSTTSGVTVTVSPPNRRFNLTRALELLTPQQLEVVQAPDAAKVKAQLPPVLLEQCMDEGTGAPRVTVR